MSLDQLLDGTRNSLAPHNGRIARSTMRLVLSCLKFDAKDFELSLKEGQLDRLPEIRARIDEAGEQLRWFRRNLARIDALDAEAA